MGLRDRWRTFKQEWDETPDPKPRPQRTKPAGECSQTYCTHSAVGSHGLCNDCLTIVASAGGS